MKKNDMTVSEFAALGGRMRWKGTTKKQRSEIMKKIRASQKKKPWDIGNKP